MTANALFNAMSPAALFGIRTIVGLTVHLYGGAFGGVVVANSSITLTANSTQYVEADSETGVIYKNVVGFTAGRLKLFTFVTGAAGVSSWSDLRQSIGASGGGGTSLSTANIFTKNQSVLPVAVSAGVITPDAS